MLHLLLIVLMYCSSLKLIIIDSSADMVYTTSVPTIINTLYVLYCVLVILVIRVLYLFTHLCRLYCTICSELFLLNAVSSVPSVRTGVIRIIVVWYTIVRRQ